MHHHEPIRRVNWPSLVLAVTAAALVTAGVVVLVVLGGPQYPNLFPIFLFVFFFALIPGIVIGVPAIAHFIRKGLFTWWSAAGAGAAASTAPGIIYLAVVANCRVNGVIAGIIMCTDGSRTATAWALSLALLAGLMVVGAFAGIAGYLTYAGLLWRFPERRRSRRLFSDPPIQ